MGSGPHGRGTGSCLISAPQTSVSVPRYSWFYKPETKGSLDVALWSVQKIIQKFRSASENMWASFLQKSRQQPYKKLPRQ